MSAARLTEPVVVCGFVVETIDPNTYFQEQLQAYAKELVSAAPLLTATQLAQLRQILSK